LKHHYFYFWFQNRPAIRISRVDKHYTRRNWALNYVSRAFLPFFMILSLRMRRNTINSTSGFKMDLKFRLLVPKNIYTRGSSAVKLRFKGIFCCFSWLYHCACAETSLILLLVSKLTSSSDSSCRKTFYTRKLCLKTAF
jgi:hypothetical protein